MVLQQLGIRLAPFSIGSRMCSIGTRPGPFGIRSTTPLSANGNCGRSMRVASQRWFRQVVSRPDLFDQFRPRIRCNKFGAVSLAKTIEHKSHSLRAVLAFAKSVWKLFFSARLRRLLRPAFSGVKGSPESGLNKQQNCEMLCVAPRLFDALERVFAVQWTTLPDRNDRNSLSNWSARAGPPLA